MVRSWHDDNHKRNFVFRAIGLLEALYGTLLLAKTAVENEGDYANVVEVVSSNLARQLLRGEQKTLGKAKGLQDLGLDYQEERSLLPGAFDLLVERLILRLPGRTL